MPMMNILLSRRGVAGWTGLLLASLAGGTHAAGTGSLDAPAAPTETGNVSAMYTLTDLYNRLLNGTTVAKRVGPFREPTNGPTSGTYTLNDIMGLMPVVDNVNGATTANVLSGKTFWGLTSGQWKL